MARVRRTTEGKNADGAAFTVERGTVSLDESPSWPAWLSPWRWNGWGVPFFDRETADSIMDYVNRESAKEPDLWGCRIERDGDRYTVVDLIQPEGTYAVEPVEIDGRPHWEIGGCAWCWSVHEDDGEAAPMMRDTPVRSYFTADEVAMLADALDAFDEVLEDAVRQYEERPARDLDTFAAVVAKVAALRGIR